jgi:hypothetical protein
MPRAGVTRGCSEFAPMSEAMEPCGRGDVCVHRAETSKRAKCRPSRKRIHPSSPGNRPSRRRKPRREIHSRRCRRRCGIPVSRRGRRNCLATFPTNCRYVVRLQDRLGPRLPTEGALQPCRGGQRENSV